MVSFARVRLSFLLVAILLVQSSTQQEIFEDAVDLENLTPEFDTSLIAPADEYDVPDEGTPTIENPESDDNENDQEPNRAENLSDERNKFSQAAPDFRGYMNNDNDRIDYNDDAENLEADETANKRSQLHSTKTVTDKSNTAEKIRGNSSDDKDGDGTKTKEEQVKDKEELKANKRSKLHSTKTLTDKSNTAEKIRGNSSDDKDGDGTKTKEEQVKDKEELKANKRSKLHSTKTLTDKSTTEEKISESNKISKNSSDNEDGEGSAIKEEKVKDKEAVIAPGSGEGLVVGEGEVSDEESSGAERERRQALQTEEQVIQAKEKLQNAVEASDALTGIEQGMGLDPAGAPVKTQNLTSALHSEIDKFKDIISKQHDDVKKSKFQKLEKLAEEDVKGANSVMRLIVELEVAKFFAKHRARKKLELALRNKISTPPSSQYQAPPATGYGGMEPNPYQGSMSDYMPYQDQNFDAQNPYAAYTTPQAASQAPSFFAPQAAQPQVPFQPAPQTNPLEGRYFDNVQQTQPASQAPSYFAPQAAQQDYSSYVGTPMNYGSSMNFMPQQNPQPFQANYQQIDRPAPQKPAQVAPVHKGKKLFSPPQYFVAKQQDEAQEDQSQKDEPQADQPQEDQPQEDKPQEDRQQGSELPKSSPFSGLKPLQSITPFHSEHIQQHIPSFSSSMKSEPVPLSSFTQSSFSASSSRPFSDALSHQKPQAFYPQSSWAPPAQVNRFSDSLSHLTPEYLKPVSKPLSPKPPPSVAERQRPHPPDLGKILADLVRHRSRPPIGHIFNPRPEAQLQMEQQFQPSYPQAAQAPPMYSQFDMPSQSEPAVPIQPSQLQFNQPSPQYYQPAVQFTNQQPVNQVPYLSQQSAFSAALPNQEHAPQFSKEQENDEDINPANQQFNDGQGLQYQGSAAYQQQYPYQQQQPYGGYNSWPNPALPSTADSYQSPYSQGYGYQSYEQMVNPLLTEALTKVHDTQKAAKVVKKIEDTIGLSPPAVNHIIDDVELETKNEKNQFDQVVHNEQNEIQKEKNLMKDAPNNDELKKKIEVKEKKLDEDRKREDIAKTKLATIKKIENILTIIETAKYSALKRAKQHLMRLKSEGDPQIRKRSLEVLERDLNTSEKKHLHRRSNVNIWLKGSKNNINASHFSKGEHEEKSRESEKKFDVFSSPNSIPQLAKFAGKITKKENITSSSTVVKRSKIKKPAIGVVLMRKLLTRMDDLYDMESKILTQLIEDHQKLKDVRKEHREEAESSGEDSSITKRSLEGSENDPPKSETSRLSKRSEINIYLKGSKNNIDTSHFLKRGRKEKKSDVYSFPDSAPQFPVSKFAVNFSKKGNIASPSQITKRNKINKPKIGVILMRKMLKRMDGLYNMQAKILAQLIKDRQQQREERERE